MSTLSSPFKFLDSYQKADADVFFGREKETLALYAALSGVKHLLVYGPSGAGKTSLVECGLRNQFSDVDWYALTMRKGDNINASFFAGINQGLDEKIELDNETKMPVATAIDFGHAVATLFAECYQPVYLLFDQFEELLISGSENEKQTFFTQLNKLIRTKLPCRIMLIMREEFIGHLSEFEPLCPSIFQHRFRVEKMGRKNVQEVIYSILEATRYKASFAVTDSHDLAKNILSRLPDNKKEIELAHVQVFLGELWDRAQSAKTSNCLPVLHSSLIKHHDDLEGILDSFLKKQIKELETGFGEGVPLELLAAMISERFTKLQLSEKELKTDLDDKNVSAKLPIPVLLKELEQRRIIRTLKAGDATHYEISHDVLALVVGQNLTDLMKMRERAGDIYKVYAERQGLFTQDDIDYLRSFQLSLTYPAELKKKIDESIAAIKMQVDRERIKTGKRLRTLYGLLGLASVALIVVFYFNANAATEKARESEMKSKFASIRADSSKVLADKALKNIINRDFYSIVKLTEPITDVGGCPGEYLAKLDSIAALFPERNELKRTIDSIKTISNCNK
jgi:hypothetical protein